MASSLPDDDLESGGLPEWLRDPFGILRRRWRWMLLALLAGLAAAGAFAATRKPRYEASATLLVTTQQIREDLVRTTLQDDLLQRIDGMVGKVLSRENLVELIEKHDPYPELRETLPMSEIAARVREDVVFQSQQALDVRRQDPSARLFTLTVAANRPAVAAGLANDLAGLIVNLSIEQRSGDAELALRFLRSELERAEREMREHSRVIREFKEQYRGELPGELASSVARLDRLQQQRQSLALQIAEANTQLAELVTGEPGVADQSPEARLVALRAELKEKEAVLTERHPEVQWLRRQIEVLEAAVGGSKKTGEVPSRPTLVAAAQQTVEELRRQLARTEAELGDLDARVARTPARQEELDALEGREEVLQEQYRDALRKVHEGELAASLESAQQGARVSVLEQAVPPAGPTRSRAKILAAGVLASLALALGAGLLLETLDPVLVTARQVEAESGLAVLGSAPHIA
jgi:uncharacterized protein involved in exopolysaccharide biosynthesis